MVLYTVALMMVPVVTTLAVTTGTIISATGINVHNHHNSTLTTSSAHSKLRPHLTASAAIASVAPASAAAAQPIPLI